MYNILPIFWKDSVAGEITDSVVNFLKHGSITVQVIIYFLMFFNIFIFLNLYKY